MDAGGPRRPIGLRDCPVRSEDRSDQILPTSSSDGVSVAAPSFHLAGQT